MESDLSLINKIKESNDEKCLVELINRHSGIYTYIVDKFAKNKNSILDRTLLMEDKDYVIYKSALNYDPDQNSKFSTYLANETKWKCLNFITSLKKKQETSLDDLIVQPSTSENCTSEISKFEAFDILENFLSLEVDDRIKKIIDIRYNSDNNKLIPWKDVAKKMNMSIQGCINLHNKFIKKVKKYV